MSISLFDIIMNPGLKVDVSFTKDDWSRLGHGALHDEAKIAAMVAEGYEAVIDNE